MSDPVMDAACRVTLPGGLDPTVLPLMVAAAREALAPIRALHRKHTDGEEESYCVECCHIYGDGYELTYQPWPCDTARLIYTSEELNDE
ncbi:hypothetical protein MYK68_16000 [Gordonia sp. PP30]|uniref:hypothetical protein n=1 Tax=Gordonia sp. PP30 TaxID=2935861 RepID=UPI001FFF623E|nr:hypothetical protein [Gordonia sp. PP30]UQE74214.1 hypothetical protein MYK68_16000 [Gordonia sp. PP30]